MKKIFILLIGLTCLSACYNNQKQSVSNKQSETSSQKQLEEEGWQLDTPNGGDLSKEYGVTPIKGLQDNYFDITVGKGCSVAIKIMDTATNRCIRYVYVPEGQTVTINEIPQGIYYLKLAYGSDWMTYKTDSVTIGKFTRNAFYERSRQIYDFGKKNSQEEVNFDLRINVKDAAGMNNFETAPISEEDFLK
jgi:hypothetical protein